MARRFVRGLVWGFAFLLWTVSATIAHHSFDAEYDGNKPVTLKGVITKVEWMNPHIRFYVDVKDVKWEITGPSVNALTRNGAKKDALKVGQSVTVQGFLARNVKNLANMQFVKSADGKLLLDRLGDQQ